MELVTSTPKERFETASAELSAHCFEVGRLKYAIELDEEALEKKRLQLKNMRIDFDKLNKIHQRATEDYLAKKEPAEDFR